MPRRVLPTEDETIALTILCRGLKKHATGVEWTVTDPLSGERWHVEIARCGANAAPRRLPPRLRVVK
jgi:hypothetical protein